jgi:RNA polymerase sigma-70 factor (ECF subfamily)
VTGAGARAAEAAARDAYGRLLAMLAVRFRDITAAEDALADAFASALATWPVRGVPDSPEAWLFAAARNRLESARRRARVRADAEPELVARALEAGGGGDGDGDGDGDDGSRGGFGDQRLALLFVCAHPAIDEGVRTPLMLQTVLGLDAERIGAAFLVAPKTMGQRLVRAKTKIREAGIPFEVPDPRELGGRLEDVLAAIYAAYGAGWDDLRGEAAGLADEALFLGRLVASLLPGEPEARGLLSLMLFCESRRAARRDERGRFVPLSEQDRRLWSRPMIIEADALLTAAARHGRFGRFQCEAAIQSVHAQRAATGVTQHGALRVLYDLLFAHAPTTGVAVARAAALCDAGDVDGAGAALDALPPAEVARYQPYWVTRARVAECRGDLAAARGALERGIGLTEDPAVRDYLIRRRGALPG